MQEVLQQLWIPLAMAVSFGAFTGSLFRLSGRPGSERPLMFPVLGLLGGLTAFMIHQVLVWTVGAPTWAVPWPMWKPPSTSPTRTCLTLLSNN